MIKLTSIKNELGDKAEITAFADTKTDVTSGMVIVGLPSGITPAMGSSILTADGEVALLKTDGIWNWVGQDTPQPIYQEKTVTPDFSNGSVEVTKDSGYDALANVTINKDSNLIADNIKKDITVHGITGTFEGGASDVTKLKSYLERTVTTIDDSVLERIGAYAFYKNNTIYHSTGLTSVRFQNVLTSGDYTFAECTELTTVDFPSLIETGGMMFNKCTALLNVNMPNLKHLISNTFSSCTKLVTLNFPNLEEIWSNPFPGCSKLTTVDFGNKLNYLSTYTFIGCSKLNTVILRCPTMVSITNKNTFNDTPFLDDVTTATLYVPQSTISDYEADSVWSQILAHTGTTITAIEGSPYDNNN